MADQDDTKGQQGQSQADANGEDDLMKKINDLKQADEGSVHESYQQQIQELEAKVKDAEDRALRSLAELRNAQQRMEQDKASFAAFANQRLVVQLIDIYENYHRLMAHEPTWLKEEVQKRGGEEWLKGLELIDQQFSKFMEQQGVKQIEAQPGEKLNPEKHEAMMTGDGEKDLILEVYSAGYEMNGRVIKTAKVKVGNGLPSAGG